MYHVVDVCTTIHVAFGSIPNLSTDNNTFHIFYVCCDISEEKGLILFIQNKLQTTYPLGVSYRLYPDAVKHRLLWENRDI